MCKFCHECPAGELKKRKDEKESKERAQGHIPKRDAYRIGAGELKRRKNEQQWEEHWRAVPTEAHTGANTELPHDPKRASCFAQPFPRDTCADMESTRASWFDVSFPQGTQPDPDDDGEDDACGP